MILHFNYSKINLKYKIEFLMFERIWKYNIQIVVDNC